MRLALCLLLAFGLGAAGAQDAPAAVTAPATLEAPTEAAEWAQEEAEATPTLWGVRFDVELPVDGDVVAFLGSPLAYPLQHPDALRLSAFVEHAELGGEVRVASGQEVSARIYWAVWSGELFGINQERNVGLRFGHRAADGWFVRLGGSVTLYGSF